MTIIVIDGGCMTRDVQRMVDDVDYIVAYDQHNAKDKGKGRYNVDQEVGERSVEAFIKHQLLR